MKAKQRKPQPKQPKPLHPAAERVKAKAVHKAKRGY
jgi:hypothetical protein